MQTTGPYAPVAGTSIIVDDPAKYTPANERVQIQNNSGMQLAAVLDGWLYSIAPYTATTIRVGGAVQLTMTPSTSITSSGGYILCAWMQPGDVEPTPDGNLVGTAQVI